MYDNKDLTRYAKGTKILFQGFSTLTKAVFTARATSPRAFSLPSRAFTTVETHFECRRPQLLFLLRLVKMVAGGSKGRKLEAI